MEHGQRTPFVEIFPDAEGGYRFRLKGGQGENQFTSESYTTKAGAERGLDEARENLRIAAVMVVEPDRNADA